MAAHTAPATRVVDLNGKTVMPGLIDGHAHMDREGLAQRLPGARTRALDPGHPGSHRRARPRQEARRMDRHHADRRSALLLRRAGHPGREALADAAGARRRGAEQSGVHPLDLGLLARHVCRSSPAPTPRRSSAPASRATRSRRSPSLDHREGRERRSDRRLHRAGDAADRGADLVPRRRTVLARRPRCARCRNRRRPIMPSAPPASSRATASRTNCCASTRTPTATAR